MGEKATGKQEAVCSWKPEAQEALERCRQECGHWPDFNPASAGCLETLASVLTSVSLRMICVTVSNNTCFTGRLESDRLVSKTL